MANLQKLQKKLVIQNELEGVWFVILLLYSLMDVPMPTSLAEYFDTTLGNTLIIFGVLGVFTKYSLLLGLCAAFAAYHVILRSSKATGNYAIAHILPSEQNKYEEMIQLNEDHVVIKTTLEEELVQSMVPVIIPFAGNHNISDCDPNMNKSNEDGVEQNYNPVLDSSIASSLL